MRFPKASIIACFQVPSHLLFAHIHSKVRLAFEVKPALRLDVFVRHVCGAITLEIHLLAQLDLAHLLSTPDDPCDDESCVPGVESRKMMGLASHDTSVDMDE